MNALDLLDEHLVRIGNKLYPKSKVERVYNKLSSPPASEFYQSERVQGWVDPSGDVSVATRYPDVNPEFSLYKPDNSQMPPPYREMGGMIREFKDYTQQNPALYTSSPVGAEGNRISDKMGFDNHGGFRFIDTRRFKNLPAVRELLNQEDLKRYGMYGYDPSRPSMEELKLMAQAEQNNIPEHLFYQRSPQVSGEFNPNDYDDYF